MNIRHTPPSPPTTRAAEGLPRKPWTRADIERMVEVGILHEHERIEMIGGELVPMSPKGAWHETVKSKLIVHFARALPADTAILTETTLWASNDTFYEPDFVFWPAAIRIADLKPRVCQLLVEVSDSSLAYDRGRKAVAYAALGVPEYWVVDARSLVTLVHRLGDDGTYAPPAAVPHMERLTPHLLPSLTVCLADLGLTPD